MHSNETFIEKRFQVINQLDGHTVKMALRVVYLPHCREINISRAISQINQSGINLINCHIFYMDIHKKMYVHLGQFPFHNELTLKSEIFLEDTIKIRYRKIRPDSPDAPAPPQRKKVKERTIKQALQYVELWRNLYNTKDEWGKKVYTLESAALIVGLAKKTLDDYFYQLKQAQEYGFDFERHRDDKIGVLRNFVRQCIRRRNSGPGEPIRSQRHKRDDIDRYFGSSDSDSDLG